MVREGRTGNGEAANIERAVGDGQPKKPRRAKFGDEGTDFGFDIVGVSGGEVGGGPVLELAGQLAMAGVEERPVEIETDLSHP